MILQVLVKTSHQIKKQHPNDMSEKSSSQLILLRNKRWVVRISVLEVFCDAYNDAVVAICQYIIDEPSSWNSKSATLSSVCVLHLPSSHGRTFSIIPRDIFGSPRHFPCPSYVFVSDRVFSCHSVHSIHHRIFFSFISIQFSCHFIAAHGSVQYRNAGLNLTTALQSSFNK